LYARRVQLQQRHSLRSVMMVPLMIRFFELVTTDGEMKAEDLKAVPLGRVQMCADNDIIWGTHPIVDHKELEPEDIEFNLVCTKIINENKHCTVFTQDTLIKQNIIKIPEEYSVYVEWGTAQTVLPYTQLSDSLKEYLSDYYSPHGGVSIGIRPSVLLLPEARRVQHMAYRYNLQEKHNQRLRQELFACLGLPENADFDVFAEKFGGLSRAEILKRLQ